MELELEIVKEIGAYIIGKIVHEVRNNPIETEKRKTCSCLRNYLLIRRQNEVEIDEEIDTCGFKKHYVLIKRQEELEIARK